MKPYAISLSGTKLSILLFVGILFGLLAPGPASALNSAYLGGESSILNRQGSLSVNQLNGQAFFNITLAAVSCKSGLRATADLSYSSLNIHRKVDAHNEEVNVGCAGLGWNLGTSFIRVYHNNTVTTDDDQWFLYYSSGASSEIIRYGTSFLTKAYPDNIVTPHYESGTSIIDGWTISQYDGSTWKFGDFGGTVNANRFVQCQDGVISPELTGTTQKYYYQWDLSSVTDVNNNSVTYLYYQITRTTPTTGLPYTGESYRRFCNRLNSV